MFPKQSDIAGLLVVFSYMAVYGVAQRSGETLTVTTVLDPPFMMKDVKGNFEGFIKDILDGLSDHLDVSFDLKVADDGKYGQEQPDGSWNGMVGEVQRGEVDMAAGALAISVMRSLVVAFTKPFLNSGTVILGRPSPHVQNVSTLAEAAESLGYSYGYLDSSYTSEYFRGHKNADLEVKMLHKILSDPELVVSTTAEGVQKAADGDYYFLTESVSADYWQAKECRVVSIGGLLHTHGIGFALQKNLAGPSMVTRINQVLLKMLEDGSVHELHIKWWPKSRETCSKSSKGSPMYPLVLLVSLVALRLYT